jgi:hypothetical protein
MTWDDIFCFSAQCYSDNPGSLRVARFHLRSPLRRHGDDGYCLQYVRKRSLAHGKKTKYKKIHVLIFVPS